MRQLIRLAVVLGMLATTLQSGAAVARADVVNPSLDNKRAGITVIVGGPGGGGGGGGGTPSCTWRMNTLDDFYNWTHLGAPNIIVPPRVVEPPPPVVPWSYAPLAGGPQPGTWFLSFCGDDINFHWVMLDGSTPPVDLQALRDAALAYLEPPKPKIGVSPDDDLVVNVPTWLWVDKATWDARPWVKAQAGNGVPQIFQEATVTAEPQSLRFTMGDGGSTTCEERGTEWTRDWPADARSPSHCDYLYQRAANHYTITANVVWRIEWSARGVVNQAPTFLGTITTSSTVNRRVVEVQTIN